MAVGLEQVWSEKEGKGKVSPGGGEWEKGWYICVGLIIPFGAHWGAQDASGSTARPRDVRHVGRAEQQEIGSKTRASQLD